MGSGCRRSAASRATPGTTACSSACRERTPSSNSPAGAAIGHHRRIRPPGLFALYIAGYSGFRIFEEQLRTDPAHHVLGLRLNFFVAGVLCIGGLVWFWRTQHPPPRRWSRAGPTALGLGWMIAVLSGCGHGTHAPATAHDPSARGSDVPIEVTERTGPAPGNAGGDRPLA